MDSQTVFDQMFIQFFIEMAEHQAAHQFIDALGNSGAAIPSLDLSAEGGGPRHTTGDRMSEKRMIFSGAYRHMTEHVDSEVIETVMSLCHSPYKFTDDMELLKNVADYVNPGLVALAKYYKISGRRDPRRIIKSQLYVG